MSPRFRRLLFVMLWGMSPAGSRASCGSAVCPLETLDVESREKGWGRVGYDFEYIDQDRARVGTRRADVGEIPGRHDEVYTVNRVHRFSASYGFTDRLSADALLPVVSRSHQHVEAGEAETWAFTGMGDLSLIGRYAFFMPGPGSSPSLSFSAGGKFPTGKRRELSDDGEEAEPGITPGTKSYDLILGLSSHWRFKVPAADGLTGAMPVFLTSTYQFGGKGEERYRLGDTWLTNLGMSCPVTLKLSLLAQLNLRVRGRDGRGDTAEEVEKTGGEFLYLSPGLQYEIARGFSGSAVVQLPVYRRVNEIQLVSDYNLLLNASYRFKTGG